MDNFLSRPEFQSAVIPFIVGLLFYFGLRKLSAYAWGWAVFSAFLISATLINGFTLTPLTGTRKIILLILASFIIIALVRQLITSSNLQRMLLPVVGVAVHPLEVPQFRRVCGEFDHPHHHYPAHLRCPGAALAGLQDDCSAVSVLVQRCS